MSASYRVSVRSPSEVPAARAFVERALAGTKRSLGHVTDSRGVVLAAYQNGRWIK